METSSGTMLQKETVIRNTVIMEASSSTMLQKEDGVPQQIFYIPPIGNKQL